MERKHSNIDIAQWYIRGFVLLLWLSAVGGYLQGQARPSVTLILFLLGVGLFWAEITLTARIFELKKELEKEDSDL